MDDGDVLILALSVGVAALALYYIMQDAEPEQDAEQVGQDDWVWSGDDGSYVEPEPVIEDWLGYVVANMSDNRSAFLNMLMHAEGTTTYAERTLFGGARWGGSMDAHPYRQGWPGVRGDWIKSRPGQELTTAAGAYQFVVGTWERVANSLRLPNFERASQDAAAIELIRQRGALADVDAGRIEQAIYKCSSEWASLPGGTSGQSYRSMPQLLAWYRAAGGA